jgi:hypothetical protein
MPWARMKLAIRARPATSGVGRQTMPPGSVFTGQRRGGEYRGQPCEAGQGVDKPGQSQEAERDLAEASSAALTADTSDQGSGARTA